MRDAVSVSARPHLLVALSSHGFGHLSQAAPVVNQLRTEIPGLRVTVRAAFPADQIARRIPDPDAIMPAADDFGMVMHDALSVDVAGVPVLYVERRDWPETQALTDWLDSVGHCAEIDAVALRHGTFAPQMDALLARGRSVPVDPSGNLEGAQLIRELLGKG